MPSDAEERAIEVKVVRAIRECAHKIYRRIGIAPTATAYVNEFARAAIAAVRAHDAETLNRVVMDSEGNVIEREKPEGMN